MKVFLALALFFAGNFAMAHDEPPEYRYIFKTLLSVNTTLKDIGVDVKYCIFKNNVGQEFIHDDLGACLYRNLRASLLSDKSNPGEITAGVLVNEERMMLKIKWKPVRRNWFTYLTHLNEIATEKIVIWINDNLFSHFAYSRIMSNESVIGEVEVTFPENFAVKHLAFVFYPIKKEQGQLRYFGRATIKLADQEKILDLDSNVNLIYLKRKFFVKGETFDN